MNPEAALDAGSVALTWVLRNRALAAIRLAETHRPVAMYRPAEMR